MKTNATSAITFLSFLEMEEARQFFDTVLGLERVYDPQWAPVWRIAGQAFIGAVDAGRSSLPLRERGGVLVSLTVPELEPYYERIVGTGRYSPTPIKEVPGIPLRSFFLKGPEGYDFEFQQFTDQGLLAIF